MKYFVIGLTLWSVIGWTSISYSLPWNSPMTEEFWVAQRVQNYEACIEALDSVWMYYPQAGLEMSKRCGHV